MDLIRQDTRQFFHSSVYHCKGERFAVFIEGKKLYEGFKLSGVIGGPDFKIVYKSPLLEEIDFDYDAQKVNVISSLKQRFKDAKLKESFECVITDHGLFFVEIYYLKVICKVLIKISVPIKEEHTKLVTDKLQSITKPKMTNEMLSQTKIIQLITLNFSEINHPEEELSQDQIRRLMKLLTFCKFKHGDKFYVEPINQLEFQEILRPPVVLKTQNKWPHQILSTDRSPKVKAAFSELHQELRSVAEHKCKRIDTKSMEEAEKTSMLPSIRWEFNPNMSMPNHDVDEEHEMLTHHASSIDDNAVQLRERDYLDQSLDAIKNNPKKILASKKLKSRLSLKPIMFALYSFNSLRRQQKRSTTPVISVNEADEKANVFRPMDKDLKMAVQVRTDKKKSKVTEIGNGIASQPEKEESQQTPEKVVRRSVKVKTVISQGPVPSVRSHNPDLQLEYFQKSEKIISDHLSTHKKSVKIKRSSFQRSNSRILENLGTIGDQSEELKLSKMAVIAAGQPLPIGKKDSSVSIVSYQEVAQAKQQDPKLETGSVSISKESPKANFFKSKPRNTVKKATEKPTEGFFKIQTLKKGSSQSIAQLPDEPKTISREPSSYMKESQKPFAKLDPPLRSQKQPERSNLGLKRLPKESPMRFGTSKGQSEVKLSKSDLSSSDNDE